MTAPALRRLFAQNRAWAAAMRARDPRFFRTLAVQQAPQYLWVGCADSRVPANVIVGLLPGEIFVHRNVANLVVQTDLNGLSVMQFAVDVLKVRHVIVCGHYGCGGVQAAFTGKRLGLVDNWLRHVQGVAEKHRAALSGAVDPLRRLCALNVVEQVLNASRTTVLQEAWRRGQRLTVHGWIYDLADGLLRDLRTSVSGSARAEAVCRAAAARLARRGGAR